MGGGGRGTVYHVKAKLTGQKQDRSSGTNSVADYNIYKFMSFGSLKIINY